MDDLFLFDLEDIKFLIIKSLSNQKKTSKAIELSNSIIDTKNKILAEFYISRSYSELGKSNSLFEKCIENTLALSTIDLKCNILSELAIQLTLFGNYDSIEFLVNEIPNLQDKLIICQDKIIPEILNSVKLKDDFNIVIDKEVIEYIINNKTTKESGVRQLRKNIEKIINRLNYDILIGNFDKLKRENNDKNIIITRTYIDDVLKLKTDDTSYLNMYL